MDRTGLSAWRWWILALLFLATTINYLDRIVFSVLIPVIRQDLRLTDESYGYITGAFQIAYTIGFLFAGKIVDRFGTRLGYAAATVCWSVAAGLHALAKTGVGLGFWRAMLGIGESGNFPAAIKAVAEWFRPRDRAFATGVFNSGTNIASVVGPPVFVWLNLRYGWRSSFVFTACSGFVWVALWLLLYRNPPIAAVESENEARTVGWAAAFRYRETWTFGVRKFLTDPVWWFYLFWLPPYLYDVRRLDLKQIGWALPVIYSAASAGSLAGGWLSGYLMQRGWSRDSARRTAMAVCAGCMPIAAMAVFAPGTMLTIALFGLATGAHQGWSANLYTTTSDALPKSVVGSVTGIGGCLGGIGGFFFSAIVPGYVVPHFGYTPIVLVMGVMHLLALFLPRLWSRRAMSTLREVRVH